MWKFPWLRTLGNVPLGSYLGCHLFDNNSKITLFQLDRPVDKIRVPDNSQKTVILPFPELPKNLSTVFIPLTNIDKVHSDVLKKITVDLAESKNIENITVRQSLEPEWFE